MEEKKETENTETKQQEEQKSQAQLEVADLFPNPFATSAIHSKFINGFPKINFVDFIRQGYVTYRFSIGEDLTVELKSLERKESSIISDIPFEVYHSRGGVPCDTASILVDYNLAASVRSIKLKGVEFLNVPEVSINDTAKWKEYLEAKLKLIKSLPNEIVVLLSMLAAWMSEEIVKQLKDSFINFFASPPTGSTS